MAVAPPEARRRRGLPWARRGVLLLPAAYFIVPLYAAFAFAVAGPDGFGAFTGIGDRTGFLDAFSLSLTLAVVTTVITLVLMVSTAIWVHLRLPRVQRLFEGITRSCRSSSRRLC